MDSPEAFLKDLVVVLGIAALTGALFQRLRQPVVLGYVLAGLLLGPHVPFPLVANLHTVQTLSEFGVILLMFSIGLEFSLRKLARVGPVAGLVAILEVSLMFWLGYLVAGALHWDPAARRCTGGIVAISSTMIASRAMADRPPGKKISELIFGVLICEDLLAILLLTILTGASAGGAVSAEALLGTLGRLAAFLIGLLVVGLLLVPRLVRRIARRGSAETLLLLSIALCFGAAVLAHAAGYSVALGAFLAGTLVAESGDGAKVEPMIEPLRDLFAAIFFVSVGMLIDPALIWQHRGAVLLFFALVVVGKTVGVGAGAFLTGHSLRTALGAGLSLSQIGEFSFIIAGAGLAKGADFLYPVAVAVSVLSSFSTPWLMRAAGPMSGFIDRWLPRRLQVTAALYGSWVEGLREGDGARARPPRTRRLLRMLALDTLCLAGGIVAASLCAGWARQSLGARGLSPLAADALLLTLAAVVSAPLLLGVVRNAQQLSIELSQHAIPRARAGQADLGAAPRRVLVASLRVTILLLVGVPLLALTYPVLPALPGAAVLVGLILLLGLLLSGLWRGGGDLHGHVRAGAQALVEVLARQAQAHEPGAHGHAHGGAAPPGGAHGNAHAGDVSHGGPLPGDATGEVQRILPGLGTLTTVRLPASSPAAGKTLLQINLRGSTGATVLALQRGASGVAAPGAKDMLLAGDVVVLAGTEEALAAARGALLGTEPAGKGGLSPPV